MSPLILTEGDSPSLCKLGEDTAQALMASGLALVARTSTSGEWQVSAARKIGVARVGDLQVIVKPKVLIDRLVFMMGYAREPSFWRDHTVLLDAHHDLADALAESFRRLATRALAQGLLHGYVSIEDTLPVLRGRIREGDQIRSRFGMALPLEVRYDEFTVDIAENRLLLTATTRLLRMPRLSAIVRKSLHRLRLQLADVTPLPRGLPLPRWTPSRLNVRYQPALRLTELILAGDSFDQRIGRVAVSGFVFDMWQIYEDFVCVALREALKEAAGRPELQLKRHLDEASGVQIRPDFVLLRGNAPVVVVDAKYKAEKPAGFPNADLYQLLAYCTVFGLADGHLVYAKGEETQRTHKIIGSPVRIHCHTLDLAVQPRNLLSQVADLGAKLIHAGTTRPNDR